MKSSWFTLLLGSLLLLQSCERMNEAHYAKVTRKTLNYDEGAYTGDWILYRTIT